MSKTLSLPAAQNPTEQNIVLAFLGGFPGGSGIGYPLQYTWASLVAQLVKNPPAMWRPGFDPWVGKMPWRREQLPTPGFWPREVHGQRSRVGYNP